MIPAAAAVVAAPMRKLCVKKWFSLRPMLHTSHLMALLRDHRGSLDPFDYCKRGESGWVKYDWFMSWRSALAGHKLGFPLGAMQTVTLWQNGSD